MDASTRILTKKDLPGVSLPKDLTIPELKRWLQCRNGSLKGKKGRSVSRSFRMMTLTPERLDRLIYIFYSVLLFFFHIQNPGICTEWFGN